VDVSVAADKLTISLGADNVAVIEIYKTEDYKSAHIGVSPNNGEYLDISYRWRDDIIPDFVFNVMQWMQSNTASIEEAKVKNKKVLEDTMSKK
jgi:hypothetical protein